MINPNFRILVSLDLTEQSIHAVNYACVLSNQLGASVYFLYVVENEKAPLEQENSKSTEYINKVLSKLKPFLEHCNNAKHFKPSNIFVEYGKVYEQITLKINEVKANLLIMGCNSTDNSKNRFLGSNTLRIMRSSEVPVITCNAYSRLQQFNRIVLPVDLTKNSNSKLQKAISFIKLNPDIILSIISVVFDADEFLINRLGQQMVSIKNILEKNNIKFTAEIIKASLGYESLGEILTDYARKVEGDTIMLISQQEISNTPYFVSSLAQEIINISEVPVMTFVP
ncbi:MAG: universal stress protein [Bacteroidia bacterium]|nr:universal stress protein [Bacteroidia bacterium]MCZ2249662.1 universal stress protein [Bacteroidia bacterium]